MNEVAAPFGSVLPEASVAMTTTVCGPSAGVSTSGEVHARARPSAMQVKVEGSLAEKETLTSAAFVQAGGAASIVVTGGVRSGSVLSTTNARRLPGSGTQLGVEVRTAAPPLASSEQRIQATALSAPGGSTTMA